MSGGNETAGRNYWRTLQELADSTEFAAAVEREAPRFRDMLGTLDRRRFLQLMAASLALGGLSGCGPEAEPRQLLPYVEQPPDLVPGRWRHYATATTHEGYATGVLISHQMARPVKVEGNPDHPASRGAASALIQASILTLYDPRRSHTIVRDGQIESWQSLVGALFERRNALRKNGGDGLRLLTGTVTSPTLAAQIAALQQAFPAMRWHQWEPLARDNEMLAARQALGRPCELTYDLGPADAIFAVESDLISAAPGHLAYARQFAARRRPAETDGTMSRVYAIESTPTLIGAKADHRLPLKPAEIDLALRYLAAAVGAGPQQWAQRPTPHAEWLSAAAEDLMQHRGRALVHVGREQPLQSHLLAQAINGALGGFGTTVKPIEPVMAAPMLQQQSLRELFADIGAGKVETLVMLDTNPVYSAPAELDVAAALRQVKLSVSLSLYVDETAAASNWHVPLAHEYEAWGDARAFDGTVSIQQPQVRRLYGGRSPLELLAVLLGDTQPEDRAIVRQFWQQEAQRLGGGDFERFWHEALRHGLIEQTAAAPLSATPPGDLARHVPDAAPEAPGTVRTTLLFRPDEGVRDGRYADNAWLLEMPRPLTRLTWDNAALLAPTTAQKLGIKNEDVIEIATGAAKLLAPVFVLPGQAADCITLPLGFGRRGGGLGAGIGFDAYRLRGGNDPWSAAAVSIKKTGATMQLASIQGHDHVAARDLIHEGSLGQYRKDPKFMKQVETDQSLYPPYEYPGRAWAMAIDLNSCIGCQACVIACQAENNIPTVGKELVLQSRVMHWLRIDRYYSGPPDNPDVAFEPMPCMHCENAPCEVVCPVHATVHDHEGLNLMVYNRCIGTRFCSNNCPYKVRRFNFFAYAMNEERVPESWNPEVTVRGRGVMEKCTYCIQRIRTTEIDADRESRKIHDGEVVTACQQSCPTQAIVFGNRNDHDSAVAKRKASPLDYVLLEDLNTRPRTSYTGLIRNPNPAIKKGET
ncbi:MAG: TAT-variant-translocated molybdopterin oxidoreductase [Thiohalocapsa sp.]